MGLSEWTARLGMAAVITMAIAGFQALPASASPSGASAMTVSGRPAAPAAQAQAIVAAAERWVTSPVTPYCWGGGGDTGPTHGDGEAAGHYSGPKGKSGCYAASVKGFDCSGLVKYAIYHALGISLYHSAQDQSEGITDSGPNVHPKIIKMADIEPGDIIVFGQSKTDIGHDGIYVGNGQIVNAYDFKNDGDNGTNNEYWGVMKMTLSWVQGGFPFAEGVRYWSTTSAPSPSPSPSPTATRTPAPAPTPTPTATAMPSPSPIPTTSPAAADDWAQAGHDPAENFDNAAETTISTSNAGRLTKAWSVSAGLVVSQPIVYRGEVYRLAGATSGTSAGVLSAASLATGKVRWRKSVSGPGAATLYGAGDGEVLYGLAGSTDELVAVSASTGARRWSRADEAFAGGAGEVLIDGSDIIEGAENVQVLTAATGGLIWQAADGAGDGGPASFAVSNGRLIRQARISGQLYLESRQLSTGTVQWTTKAPCGGSGASVNTNLGIGASLIFVHTSCSKTVRAYELSTGALAWKVSDPGGQAQVGLPTSGTTVYVLAATSGQPAIWAYSGGKAKWHVLLGAGTYAGSTPTLADGVLYVTVDDAVHGASVTETTTAFSAATGSALWTSPVMAETLDTPFVADAHLLIGSEVFRLG